MGWSVAGPSSKEERMGDKWKVTCADGFEVVSADPKELVALVQWHGQHSHQKHLSEGEVLGMAKQL
jgi:hypothetical protein